MFPKRVAKKPLITSNLAMISMGIEMKGKKTAPGTHPETPESVSLIRLAAIFAIATTMWPPSRPAICAAPMDAAATTFENTSFGGELRSGDTRFRGKTVRVSTKCPLIPFMSSPTRILSASVAAGNRAA